MNYYLEKVVLITNNDKVYEKYKNKCNTVLLNKYEDVLLRVRDEIHSGKLLLTHPQASSLKPNQTPYRSVLLYPNEEKEDLNYSIMLIEKCIEVFYQWQKIAKSPDSYKDKVANDFKTIDLSVIDEVVDKEF